MNRFDAKFGSTAKPITPASPFCTAPGGVPRLTGAALPIFTLTGPNRWVKNIVFASANAMSHGLLSPVTKPESMLSVGVSTDGGAFLVGRHAAPTTATAITRARTRGKRLVKLMTLRYRHPPPGNFTGRNSRRIVSWESGGSP